MRNSDGQRLGIELSSDGYLVSVPTPLPIGKRVQRCMLRMMRGGPGVDVMRRSARMEICLSNK
jgi:hypothetical protein